MPVQFIPGGDMFDMQDGEGVALVNAVNCVGVMGGGLALTFREKYPLMFEAYRLACLRDEVVVGKMHVWYDYIDCLPIINFPTKEHWRDPSALVWIEAGLIDLAAIVRNNAVAPWPIEQLAVPMLGCGLGGLDWHVVCPLVVRYLGGLPIDVLVYGEEC